jgi:hypothetical protein
MEFPHEDSHDVISVLMMGFINIKSFRQLAEVNDIASKFYHSVHELSDLNKKFKMITFRKMACTRFIKILLINMIKNDINKIIDKEPTLRKQPKLYMQAIDQFLLIRSNSDYCEPEGDQIEGMKEK